jgi:hypothetical protein
MRNHSGLLTRQIAGYKHQEIIAAYLKLDPLYPSSTNEALKKHSW